jgi:hypothetical protein
MNSPARHAPPPSSYGTPHLPGDERQLGPSSSPGRATFNSPPRNASLRGAAQRNATQRFLVNYQQTPFPRRAPRCYATLRPATQRNELFFTLQISNDNTRNFPNPNEAAILPDAASAGAAMNRRFLPSAESRPFPFSQVDHLAHALSSFVSPARNSGTKGRLVACAQKEMTGS